MVLSIVKVKYIAGRAFLWSNMWISQQLMDLGLDHKKIPTKCDSLSDVNITKNPCQHRRTEHMNVRHPYTRDHVEKGNIFLDFLPTNWKDSDPRFIPESSPP